ncbi:MAG: histidine phosphatase family protein [Gammaproteobacteria bacterium]|nr:histidine phosphatase family protein [Gammaproteobacteria bacterium]
MVRELIFIRHGETEWNVSGRLQGRADSPLTDVGRRQVRAHLSWLLELRPELIVTSPLGRTQATAKILADALGLEVEIDPRLAERSMGRFEGFTLDEVTATDPEESDRRIQDPWGYRAPLGENYDDMVERVTPLVDRLVDHPARRIVVVSHGTLVRVLLGCLLGLERETLLRVRQPNAVAYQVRLDTAGSDVVRWEGGCASPGLLLSD